jgi:glycine/D-amino acid oxidase-like deaminating enzyme
VNHPSISFWLQEDRTYQPSPPLYGRLDTDVAIIGGGFTGLSTALHLRQLDPSLRIAILEGNVVGFGASGRNAGFAMTLFGVSLSYTSWLHGMDNTRKAHHYMVRAVEHVGELVREHGIDCDYELPGFLRVATTPAYVRRVKREIDIAHAIGATDIEWMDQGTLAAEVRSPTYLGASMEPRCALVNPAKLARGMKRVVTAAAVQVYEGTPVTEIARKNGGISLKTPGGEVHTEKLVLATNSYSHLLPQLRGKQTPFFTYVVVTEPLTPAQLAEIGWQHRQGIEDGRNLVHYYRLTPDNRLLMGGNIAAVTYGDNMDADHNDKAFAVLERDIAEVFPCLAGHPISVRWGGPASVTADLVPAIGHIGDERVVFSLGCMGHGVALTHLNGQTIADLLLGRRTELSEMFFVDRKIHHWPPEPLRFAVTKAVLGFARAQDWLCERGVLGAR